MRTVSPGTTPGETSARVFSSSAPPSGHRQAIANVEPHQCQVHRACQQFQRLDEIELRVETPGNCLQLEINGRRQEDQQAVQGNHRHSLFLGRGRRVAAPLSHDHAGGTDNHHRRDQHEHAVQDHGLRCNHHFLGTEQLTDRRRRPERRNGKKPDQAGSSVYFALH